MTKKNIKSYKAPFKYEKDSILSKCITWNKKSGIYEYRFPIESVDDHSVLVKIKKERDRHDEYFKNIKKQKTQC